MTSLSQDALPLCGKEIALSALQKGTLSAYILFTLLLYTAKFL